MELLISLVSGAIGGNLVGVSVRKCDLGIVASTLAGLAGGGIGVFILNLLARHGHGIDPTADFAMIAAHIASGTIGGGVAMMIVAKICRCSWR